METVTWGLPTSVEVDGAEYEIRSDFRAILDICAAVNDPELSGEEKTIAALSIFYPDVEDIPPEHWQEALKQCFWFINGGAEPDGRKSPKLVDWEQDYSVIIGPVNRVLGTEARATPYLHWWTFLSAYTEIGDCTFAQVVRIRDKLVRGKSLDKQDREWYHRNRQLVDFKNKYTEADNALLREWGGV